MFNLLRNGLSAVTVILVFTVAACCPPWAPADTCPEPEKPTSDHLDMGDMPTPTKPCALVNLTKNDPVPPPLFPDIGSAHWHVPWGQDYFDQGLRFYFGFNNRESYRAFREAAREAEGSGIPCSACYWAQALVLGVDLNESKQSPDDLQEAKVVLDRARHANPNLEDQEIIAALDGRYRDCPGKPNCQEMRNRAYYNGMREVLQRFGSNDPNVITLFADAAMNLAPWHYWEKDGNPVLAVTKEITEAKKELEQALSFVQYPPNEGPIHWYIHLMEQSPTPQAAEPYAAYLAPLAPWKSLAPNSGHLVHMPSHIYFRVGDMRNAIRANKEAIEADDRYFATEPDLYRPDGDRYRYSYYPHNIHFVVAAAALSGDERDVNLYAEKLLQSAPDKASGMRADMYRGVYYLGKMNFSRTVDIRKFPRPDSFKQQPFANVAYDFTQLMADIWDNNDPQQRADELYTDVTKYRTDASDKITKGNASCRPGSEPPRMELCVTAILDDLGRARVAAWKKEWDKAVDAARDAVDIQDGFEPSKYEEPPMWPYPARQTLASMLIQRAIANGNAPDDLAKAKEQLSQSLNGPPGTPAGEIPTGTFPGNGWAYFGLLEIAKRDGSDTTELEKALNAHWFGDNQFRTLERM